MAERVQYGPRHREVATFLAILLGVVALGAPFALPRIGRLLEDAPFVHELLLGFGALLALFLLLLARQIYLLWRHPPVEIEGDILHTLDGLRRREYRLARIQGPLTLHAGRQNTRLEFTYNGRRARCPVQLLSPGERADLQRRLEAASADGA
jgi:hypothetical protein